MQFCDLAEQYKRLKDDIDLSINTVLSHNKFIMGPEVNELEKQLAEYVGVKYCITCSSGTDALLLPLMAWGIGKGDAVFTTSFTFAATAEVIALAGATPVFVDIDEDTFNIDADKLEIAVENTIKAGKLKPKIIIPVDLFGLPANYDRINEIAAKYSLRVIEDAAQGFGGAFRGKRAGSLGTVGCTSFFPSKPLGCYGDGGAVFTNIDRTDEIMRSIRSHGQGKNKYDNVRIGLNARIDTLQAAILLPKLKAFEMFELEMRNEAAANYTKRLSGVVKTPVVPEGYLSSWAQYSILLKDSEQREKIQNTLKEKDIPTMVYYPKPLHLQKAYAGEHKEGSLPVSESVAKRVLSLPMHPYLSDKQTDFIAQAIIDSM